MSATVAVFAAGDGAVSAGQNLSVGRRALQAGRAHGGEQIVETVPDGRADQPGATAQRGGQSQDSLRGKGLRAGQV